MVAKIVATVSPQAFRGNCNKRGTYVSRSKRGCGDIVGKLCRSEGSSLG
jgi:hypothetical protein